MTVKKNQLFPIPGSNEYQTIEESMARQRLVDLEKHYVAHLDVVDIALGHECLMTNMVALISYWWQASAYKMGRWAQQHNAITLQIIGQSYPVSQTFGVDFVLDNASKSNMIAEGKKFVAIMQKYSDKIFCEFFGSEVGFSVVEHGKTMHIRYMLFFDAPGGRFRYVDGFGLYRLADDNSSWDRVEATPVPRIPDDIDSQIEAVLDHLPTFGDSILSIPALIIPVLELEAANEAELLQDVTMTETAVVNDDLDVPVSSATPSAPFSDTASVFSLPFDVHQERLENVLRMRFSDTGDAVSFGINDNVSDVESTAVRSDGFHFSFPNTTESDASVPYRWVSTDSEGMLSPESSVASASASVSVASDSLACVNVDLFPSLACVGLPSIVEEAADDDTIGFLRGVGGSESMSGYNRDIEENAWFDMTVGVDVDVDVEMSDV